MIAVWVCMWTCSVAVPRALLHTTEHALTRSRAPLSDHEVSGTGEHGLGPVSTEPASHSERYTKGSKVQLWMQSMESMQHN